MKDKTSNVLIIFFLATMAIKMPINRFYLQKQLKTDFKKECNCFTVKTDCSINFFRLS